MLLKIFEAKQTINNVITQGINVSCRHKKSLYILNIRSNNPQMRTQFNKYCKILSRVIKEAKRQHYCRLIDKADNKVKTAWNIMKHESGKLKRMEQTLRVLINNEKLSDPQKIVDAFNTFFLKITENLDLHQEARHDAISFLKNAFPRKFTYFKIILTTKTAIKSIIHSLKAKNSASYNGISSKILKACASHPLTHICNQSLLTRTFPNCLKVSVVRPLHIKCDKTNMSNYRPI
jgi:hypothetical protein